MGTFAASLRALGDVQGLSATVELEDGLLSIAAGETDIGQWPVKDIDMEPIPNGYRISAEGDQVILEFKDIDRFNEELSAKQPRFKGKKKKETKEKVDSGTPTPVDEAPPPSPVKLEPRPEEVEKPRKERKKKVKEPKQKEAPTGSGAKILHFVDTTLDKAARRFGPYLPDWVFTRFTFAIVVIALIIALVLPGVASAFMLIAGALIIVFGAVIYSDPMLASRWLPGRTTPTHVLLIGVAILMIGVLLGVVAS